MTGAGWRAGAALQHETRGTPADSFRHTRRASMADNKCKGGGADRRQVSSSKGYEANYFARKHEISRADAESLIKRIGNDRVKLNQAPRG